MTNGLANFVTDAPLLIKVKHYVRNLCFFIKLDVISLKL